MSDEFSRDPELDELLAPLRTQSVPAHEVDRILAGLVQQSAAQKHRWAALAFAAGLIVGIGGTWMASKEVLRSQTQVVEDPLFSDEFATVRQVSTK
jgi:hypothetical protein